MNQVKGMKYIHFYPEKCSGCRQCSIACSLKHFGECNPKAGAISIVRDDYDRFELQFICMHCEDPKCAAACMPKALNKGEDGVVYRDADKCIGCRMCVAACPYSAINSLKGEIIKCDLCEGDPACVKYCSTNAIVYEEETIELTARRKELAQRLLKPVEE
jgi:Fe-S-cluster-containing hydrogenase component 2